MTNVDEISSDFFDSNVSSEIDTRSAHLSALETEADIASISQTRKTSKLISSIHKHCRTATKEEKTHTKKVYFCKYCPPQDSKGHHASTIRLQRHLQKHNIEWSTEENDHHMTVRD